MAAGAGVFLGGAKSRLLPASIPFRFFGAAVVFHLLAWLALLAGAPRLPSFGGGLGWPLAALHLVTLGVLAMTAIGASLQLLPVATRQPVRFARVPAAIWWLYAPGVAAVALGMGAALPWLLVLGALAVLLALLGYAVLLASNLWGARGMPGVVWHGWAALGCLLVVLATAASLALAYLGAPLIDRSTALALHAAFAAYGFMGLLAFGLSAILVPMFALAEMPDDRASIVSCGLCIAALLLAALAALRVAPQLLRLAALALAGAAVALHLIQMRGALRRGMRRELGRSFTLIKIAWAMLVLSLAAALAVVLSAPLPGLHALFMLQRILPFLASMHGVRGAGRAATPSSLTAQRPLVVHFFCHLAALAGLALAVVAGSTALATVAAAIGALGAAAFGAFFAILLRRMRPGAPAQPSNSGT